MSSTSPDTPIAKERLGWCFQRLALAVLLLVACANFVWRGPIRTTNGTMVDFRISYSATRAWLQGRNPYDADTVRAVMIAAGETDAQPVPPLLAPPVALPLMVPFALFDWPTAKILWAWFQLALMLAMVALLADAAGWALSEPRTLLCAALAMMLSPVLFAVAAGQVAILVAFLVVLGLFLEVRHHDCLAGIVLIMATAIKPHTGLIFLLLALYRMHWRTWVSAAIAGTAILALSVGQLYVHGIDWFATMQENYRSCFSPGGLCDAAASNPNGFMMIDLQHLFQLTLFDNTVSGRLALGLMAPVGLLAVYWLGNERDRRGDLLAYSIASVISLLAVYHRVYDAVILVVPLTWALTSLRTPNRLPAILVLILMLPFLLVCWPGVLSNLESRGVISHAVGNAWWWQGLVVSHEIYLLLLMAACLLFAIWTNRRPTDVCSLSTPEYD